MCIKCDRAAASIETLRARYDKMAAPSGDSKHARKIRATRSRLAAQIRQAEKDLPHLRRTLHEPHRPSRPSRYGGKVKRDHRQLELLAGD